MLPPDGHVHTEWSWDAAAGSMERSCARAVALGLPSIAFTEHADFTAWVVEPQIRALMRPENAARLLPDGRFRPPPLDAEAYLACVQRCRELFPGLRILSGTELGEPHWHEGQVKTLRWWYETGGEALVFGSDAHDPTDVARRFAGLAEAAEAAGFHPGRHPHDFWRRRPV